MSEVNRSTPAAPSGLKLWLMAIRAFSFPASVIPVLYGSVLAIILHPEIKFNFLLFVLTLLGAVFVHIGTNLINDIYDYKKGLDREDKEKGIPHGGSMVLSMKFMSVEKMWVGAVISLLIASAIGVFLYTVCGKMIMYLALFGLLSAILYTATPAALKYKALGDIQVLLSMGTGITFGAYLVQVLSNHVAFSWLPVLFSIPIGLLIDAILHANNIRDIESDAAFGVKTIPILIGINASKIFYYFLIFGAYISVIIFVVFFHLHPLALLSFITLPIALKLVKMVNENETLEPGARFIAGSQHIGMTAQFNMQFGLALTVGLLIAYFVMK
jgi:1,4-dihydroxy-2-naphthoate octaprenyltransferase